MKTSLILASASPRRAELLRRMNFDVHILPADIDESDYSHEDPLKLAKEIAEAKGRACLTKYDSHGLIHDVPILSADTLVVIGREILGKPKNRGHAEELWRKLNGGTHRVITAYHIFESGAKEKSVLRAVESKVCMAEISQPAIDWYLDKNEAYDKAGAYAIQGIGAFMVQSIFGSYTNVMGLPLAEVVDDLTSIFGLSLP
jgi:septum formation protein